jgi:pimeloyl-ACP methyl ester carboxylesterase
MHQPAQFDFAAEIRKLKEPIEPDSPFMIAWWDSPTPVDPDFIRRQRKDAAGIPFEGLGHNPFWEDPRGVAEVINAFLGG